MYMEIDDLPCEPIWAERLLMQDTTLILEY